ncbi:multidrug effflux MFS transporter [Aquirhabdus sp.]|uniref:multidrug effflux MFS transporter n=1 Tax=Aquirhabdus sp. TaxID=2824160 RepID=UPI00396CEFF0
MSGIHSREFALLMALLMSVVSFSIDATLPALGQIGLDFGVQDNRIQWVITCIFAGMTIGQLIAGPLSDAIGRKRILFSGIAIYFLGSLLCYFTTSFELFLVGRFIQGLGVSGPYITAISVVRDKYSGAQMAKVMSIIMMVFMVAPAIAPSIGQLIISLAGWHTIFLVYIIYALTVGGWIALRLEETLPLSHRIPLKLKAFEHGFIEVVSNRTTMSYLLCTGLCFGGLIAYLGSSQQIFMQQFGLSGQSFSLYFALLAFFMGMASFVNSRIVARFGMRTVCIGAMLVITLVSLLFLLVQITGAHIHLWMFITYASLLFFAFGLMFGNLNAIAMEPMGHVAGMASAIIGAVSSILSLVLATIIGQLYDNTLVPITSGFFVLCALSSFVIYNEMRWYAKLPKEIAPDVNVNHL